MAEQVEWALSEGDDESVGYERVVDDELRLVDVRVFDPDEEWRFQVGIAMAEFAREEPLESQLRREVDAALRAVEGVRDVAEEDREVWVVAGGAADPIALLTAVAGVVDRLAPQLEG